MNTLKIDTKEIAVPGTWNELTRAQLVSLSALLGADSPVLNVALRALLILLDTPDRPWLQRQLLNMTDEQRYNCLQLSKWVFNSDRLLTRQLLPTLQMPGDLRRLQSPTTLHGPGDDFVGVAFQEFIQAEGYRAAYAQRGDMQHLNQLVAILYRPARRGPVTAETARGDKREKYNDHLVAPRAVRVARLPIGERLAVLRYYDSNRTARITRYRQTLFDSDDKATEIKDPRIGWHKVLAELAGTPTQYDAVAGQPLDTVLFDLDYKIIKNRETLAEIESRS